MKTPTTKEVKIYAVLESVIEVKAGEFDNLDAYLRDHKFKGNTTVNYNQGGISNVVTKEIIPLTMKQLDAICNGDN